MTTLFEGASNYLCNYDSSFIEPKITPLACLRTDRQECQPTVVSEFFDELPERESTLELEVLHDYINISLFTANNTQNLGNMQIRCSPFLNLDSLAKAAMRRMEPTRCHMALSFEGKGLRDPYSQLIDVGTKDGSKIEMILFDFSCMMPSPHRTGTGRCVPIMRQKTDGTWLSFLVARSNKAS